MRTFMDSNQKRPLDANFDIRTYRSQIKDRLNMSISSDNGFQKFNSIKKEQSQGIPSFDNLQARIRDFSQSRVLNTSYTNNTPQKTPYKAQGMQQKISGTLGSRLFEDQRQQYQYQSQKQVQQNYSQQFSPQQQKFVNRTLNSFGSQNLLQIPGNIVRRGGRNLSDVVQLNEIVALRNKIESSTVSRSQLTSTYVSELVKLAQAITSSLKQE